MLGDMFLAYSLFWAGAFLCGLHFVSLADLRDKSFIGSIIQAFIQGRWVDSSQSMQGWVLPWHV